MAQFLGGIENVSLKPHSRGLTLLYFGYEVHQAFIREQA